MQLYFSVGAFSDVEKEIRLVTENMENVTVISGSDLVPHDTKLYGDTRLHPNNNGFDHYFSNLWNHIKGLA